jgi:hypothetical protein
MTMDNVIKLAEYRFPWREAFKADGADSTVQVYTNDRTGELEIVQMNDEGETIRTTLDPLDSSILRASLENQRSKSLQKK